MYSSTVKKLLAIPGPIELSPNVQNALALPTLSHVSPEFVKIFQESLDMTREVVQTGSSSIPFILAGSGTFGWDQVGANLVETGDRVLVLSTGYFGDGFKDCLQTYGAEVDILKSALGGTVPISEVEKALRKATETGTGRPYKLVTITHVDTSTGVLSDAQAIAACAQRISPGTLVVLDAVCSLASEDIQMDAWGLDVVLSASQKGLGGPPGLSILVASQRTINVLEERIKRGIKSGSYYSSWEKWLPIMRAYDQNKPAYFGTPAVNLVRAYHASLREITQGPISLSTRLAMHTAASDLVKRTAESLGMTQVAREPKGRAHGMTALYVPDIPGVPLAAADVLAQVGKRNIVMAGGWIGHMGWSVVGEEGRDIRTILKVLEESVKDAIAIKKSALNISARL
ncbi:pyridoxal phosphate-dependent transferase [Gymnopilus junonius]|uniref:alanine--glyoxylate transaminase n=1 Tax=Gymnopilus junonius TaxID=109634 RepID=A0A9P5TMJ0_GYMJU|nr:pyridoxal phosphate-dependent transferase [Gymnopilus junonius]